MGAPELMITLASQGFQVLAERQTLLVRPASLLTPELRLAIVEHKPELLDLAPRRHWTVHAPEREPFGIVCVQGCTRHELLSRYPDGTTAAPIGE